MTNARIAQVFEQIAALLEQQNESAHRVRAWRDGAKTVREHPRELADVFRDHGRVGLLALPHIGPRLTNAIIELVRTGASSALDRLRGDAPTLIEGVPGIGHRLAARVHAQLGIETLEDLEAAAADGRLAQVQGFGARRIAAVRDVLATRLAHRHQRTDRRIPIEVLFAIDAEYRRAAAAGELRTIAPRRFNPRREAWLPVMHGLRDGWTFTALFSNTALAHQLGHTRDWVVIYYRRGDEPEEHATVATEYRGPARGRRVVRGRESETTTRAAA